MPDFPARALRSPLGDDPLLCLVLELFVEELPQRVQQLRTSFDKREWHALRRALQQLSAAARRHGFDQLLPHAAQVEARLTHRAPTPEVALALDELVAQCDCVTAEGRQG